MRKYGNLLLVDDEAEIVEILAECFQPHFEKVITCTSAQEALGVIKSIELSAIIMDVNMPEISGDQMVRKIRAQGNLTPIAFLTGFASKELVLSAMRLGVADVFEKPFESQFLIESLDRVLEIEKRRQSLYAQRDLSKIQNEKKLLGLLQVVNEAKKSS